MRAKSVCGWLLFCTSGLLLPTVFAAEPAALKSGVDRTGFDPSVKPGDSFFLHVNGTWLKNNPIPAQYSRWGSFTKLRDGNLVVLREVLALGTIGLVIGLFAVWETTAYVKSLLFGLTPADPLTLLSAVAMLTACALVAGFAPALRASRIDPMSALRDE